MERFVERLLYSSRWLLAPIYIGLILALIATAVKFFQVVLHVLPALFSTPPISEPDLLLEVLALVDMAMVASLIVMVMFSGYENFVSKIDVEGAEKLDWMGKLDAGTLKQKIAATIVAISSIHLLQKFIGTDGLYAIDCMAKIKEENLKGMTAPQTLESFEAMCKLAQETQADVASSQLLWYVIIHLTFVVSAIGMGLLDKSTKHAH